jgi:branched-chain amino acid transport system substrate-binding protein
MAHESVSKRSSRLAGLALAAGLVLAACQPAAAPSGGAAKPTEAPKAAAPAAQPAATTAAKPGEAAKPAAEAAKPATGGEPIKIGFSAALSGGLGGLGSDQARGGELAVEEIKTVLGRPLQWIARDDKNDPGEASKQAEQLVTSDKVDMLTGCVSAATTLAINQVAKRAQILYLGTCQTNNLNDAKKDWSEYTFHFALTPWINNQMVMPWIYDNLGKKIYVLAADYAWGNENLESIQKWLQTKDVKPVGEAKSPFPTSDFTTFIPQIRAAAPEAVVAVLPGADQANFVKQATQFGLNKETKIYLPVVDTPFDQANGQANIVDTHGGSNFHFALAERLPSAKTFVEAFEQKYNAKPSGYAAYQYNAVKAWAAAAEKAGALDQKKIGEQLRGMEFDYSSGRSFIRKCDNQLFQAVHIMKGRAETQGAQGYRDFVLSIEPDEKYERSCEELGHAGPS